jgi:hypothetical protein
MATARRGGPVRIQARFEPVVVGCDAKVLAKVRKDVFDVETRGRSPASRRLTAVHDQIPGLFDRLSALPFCLTPDELGLFYCKR